MTQEWKNERPEWCPHANCEYRLRAQDSACVGYLPLPIPHGEDSNDYRFCLNGALESGEVFDLMINDSDLYHFKRLFAALQRRPGSKGYHDVEEFYQD